MSETMTNPGPGEDCRCEDCLLEDACARPIATKGDAVRWLRTIAEHGCAFHLDDEADDIWPGSFGSSMEQRRLELWSVSDPWALLESDETLSRLWNLEG